jgi:hypothetical protein
MMKKMRQSLIRVNFWCREFIVVILSAESIFYVNQLLKLTSYKDGQLLDIINFLLNHD